MSRGRRVRRRGRLIPPLPYILTVSGSPQPDSQNSLLLSACANLTPVRLIRSINPAQLPVYQPDLDRSPWPEMVLTWRQQWRQARAIIISTPAYLDNLPGVLKNALDWLATSGEADGKMVLPITFPPTLPRGEHVMQSLLWSLQALHARIPANVPLAQADLKFAENGDLEEGESRSLLAAALDLLS
ncbi:NADPH-dependent FMN reductase [Lewinella sp. IMCC34191]|uniref:NADPH-dependent FMN reductase n=1 Tax=Lewinella sp. IMCC34191 TaxID=2259172 RepID=UPI000E2723C3|nr:NADPH-dependent FMN reductase [Lewinella sp. IMCC34191]